MDAVFVKGDAMLDHSRRTVVTEISRTTLDHDRNGPVVERTREIWRPKLSSGKNSFAAADL